MHPSKTGSWFVSGKATNLSRKATTGLLATMLLLPLGCKAGESWAPKMPKFGMPEIAFGNKSAEDEIQPPAAHFTPDGDMGSPNALPERSLPGSSYTPNSLPREPYAVDEPTEDLGAVAARRSEEILQRELDESRRRIQPQADSFSRDMGSARERITQGLERIPNQNYLDSSSDPTINSIPGGSLKNEFGSLSRNGERLGRNGEGLAGSVPPALPSPPMSNGFPESDVQNMGNARIAPNSNSGGTGLVGNPPRLESSQPALPSLPSPTNGFSQLAPPSNPFTSNNNGMAGMANPGAMPPATPGQNSGFASPGNGFPSPGSGLPQASNNPLPPLNNNPTLPGLPTASPSPDPTRIAAVPPSSVTQVQYAVPNTSGGFVPGEIATTGGLETLPTLGERSQHPLGGGMTQPPSTQPGTNAPGVIQNQYDNSNRHYPSTGSPGFQPSFKAPTSLPAPGGIPTSGTGPLNGGPLGQTLGQSHPGAPAGMVCDGDQCYIPNTPR